ncbi:MAG: hypothetical protein PHV63_04040 [Candidatus Daviesbacteria bacterium]|nr:hypothetical protein [Candidatus Daviesbacteria bacterium]
MDSPNPSPLPTPEVTPQVYVQPASPLKKILKIALISLGIIVLVLVIILTLNYFNILSLSSLSPKYFSWLPHQTLQISPSKEELSSRAKKTLTAFLPNILVSSLIPPMSDITFRQDKIVKENFTLLWDTKEGTANAALTMSSDEKKISSFNILFFKSQIASPSVELAQTIIPSIFSIEPKGVWGCKPIYSQTYCENFWEDKEGIRRGVNITGPFPENKQKIGLIVSFCEHTKEAKTIYSWQSCTSEFAKTGVK